MTSSLDSGPTVVLVACFIYLLKDLFIFIFCAVLLCLHVRSVYCVQCPEASQGHQIP